MLSPHRSGTWPLGAPIRAPISNTRALGDQGHPKVTPCGKLLYWRMTALTTLLPSHGPKMPMVTPPRSTRFRGPTEQHIRIPKRRGVHCDLYLIQSPTS